MRWTQKLMREVADEERSNLGLDMWAQFDPYTLCEEHAIDVYALSEVASVQALKHFTVNRPSAWSAALVPVGPGRVIIENDRHPAVRRRSSISHELGHFLLEHDFQAVILGVSHSRQFDPKLEKEATFLSGELLVPFGAVEQMAFDGWSNQQVAAKFGVSAQFAQMQMKGQRVRAERARLKFHRSRSA